MAIVGEHNVVRTRVDRRFQHRIGRGDIGIEFHHADAIEHERHSAGLRRGCRRT